MREHEEVNQERGQKGSIPPDLIKPDGEFLVVGQYAIAKSQIQIIKYQDDGSVLVTVGRDALNFEVGSPEAEALHALTGRPVAEKPATGEPVPAIEPNPEPQPTRRGR